MTYDEVQRYLDRYVGLAPGTKIQYGHPSPRFWLPAPECNEQFHRHRRTKPLSLYLHVPFCPPTDPPACGFCLFAREDFSSYPVVRRYCEQLVLELRELGRRHGGVPLWSLYFGGGTPNMLKPAEMRTLMREVRRHFVVDADTEVTFEGYPSLFTPDRLDTLAEIGVTRISIGAQHLQERLLAYSGRRHRPDQIRSTVEFCRERGLHCSVDLITGWFEQTTADVVEDVDRLVDWGVTGVVNHPLTLAGDSPFARRAHELPTNEQMCDSFLAARERLLQHGFRADSYTDYRRRDLPVVRYLECYRDLLEHDRLGVGYGANSLLASSPEEPGLTWVNVAELGPYGERAERGASCAERHFPFTSDDLRLLSVMKGLEGTPHLRRERYAERFGGDLEEDFAPWWEALRDRGWLRWGPEGPRLVGDGVFYVATVQRCLSEPRNRQLRGASLPVTSEAVS